MQPIITIKDLSKQYRLGTIGTGTLTHDFKRWWANFRGKEDPTLQIGVENKLEMVGGEYVWALQNINMEVQQGEILGIIGKNGAGKSTLLKILSRVTTPTTGIIRMDGRVASLLEVGTGFHGELTGRENVFLNGAIMGMTKKEIKSRFDEIVDFSGVGKYIDTPVKRYSSGMYVRLAFAVAAHLEAEILIVDEVLAVGDIEFQKKAMGKMQDIGEEGNRTVLFVSHSMSAIQNLCNRVILLNNGGITFAGKTEEAIKEYMQINIENKENIDLESHKRKGIGNILFKTISLNNNKQIITGSNLCIAIKIKNNTLTEIRNTRFDIGIDNSQGTRIAHLSNQTLNKTISLLPEIDCEILFTIDNLPLTSGRYSLTIYAEAAGHTQDWIKNAYYFDVENADYYNTGKNPPEGQGNILLKYKINQI
jgi:lipopolysaccharide transport system ATP-binding protein